MPLKPPRTRLLGVSVVALTSAAAMLIAAPAAQAVSPDVVIAEVYGGGGNAGSPADGGEPGGNIRVAFMFRTDRGLAFVDRPGGTATATTTVTNAGGGQPQLSFSPGRVAPTNSAWSSSRKPLVGEFTWNGQKVFAIANHFNSKGCDDPASVQALARRQSPARTTACSGGASALRRAAQTDHQADPNVRHDRGRGPQRRRDAGQPAARSRDR